MVDQDTAISLRESLMRERFCEALVLVRTTAALTQSLVASVGSTLDALGSLGEAIGYKPTTEEIKDALGRLKARAEPQRIVTPG